MRIAVAGVVVASLFATLFARLWYLQVVAGEAFAQEANANRIVEVPLDPMRGRLLDRSGRVLVDNRVTRALTLSRSLVGEERGAVINRLSELLSIPAADLGRRLDNQRFSRYKPVPLVEDVSEEQIVYVREHQELFPGVEATLSPTRSYAHEELAAHVLGYVGEINDRELKDKEGSKSDYRLGDQIGKSGVEATFEEYLRGVPGEERFEIDSRGRVVSVLGVDAPKRGGDVQLTIDLDVQRLAEESLFQGIDAAHKGWDDQMKKHFIAPAGSLVVLDSRDGSVVAMASYPTYEPEDFTGGIDPQKWKELNDPGNHYPLNNRAIQGQYAPGSTFKLVTAMAALSAEIITPYTPFEDKGSLRVGQQLFRNAGNRVYGRVDLARALAVSSDAYFYSLGYRIWQLGDQGGNTIQDVATSLGFGERTGIALPVEQPGRVPGEEWKRSMNKKLPKAFPDGVWRPGDNVNLSIGQGDMLATPLQLAVAYAAFANGGTVFTPQIASQVLDEDGKPSTVRPPKRRKQAVITQEIRGAIMGGLRRAIVDEEGTAALAFGGFPHDRVRVAGKTGTAQVAKKQDTALFAAILPTDAPQYVVVAVVEEAGFGSSVAAPIVRRVIQGLSALELAPVTSTAGID